MVPSAFVLLDRLPLSPNGKVDRRGASRPGRRASRPGAGLRGAPDPGGGGSDGIWAQVLGLPRVGTRDNFFDLGGDSILSIQVVARANLAGLRCTPRQIFQHQTVGDLARVTAAAAASSADVLETVSPTADAREVDRAVAQIDDRDLEALVAEIEGPRSGAL